MKTLYAKFLLFFIQPALDLRDKQRYSKPVLASVRTSTREQQDEVKRDLRSRLGNKPEFHQ